MKARLAKLEAKRPAEVRRIPKEERDRAVAAIFSDPEELIEIRDCLLGSREYAQRNIAVIIAALRADT